MLHKIQTLVLLLPIRNFRKLNSKGKANILPCESLHSLKNLKSLIYVPVCNNHSLDISYAYEINIE